MSRNELLSTIEHLQSVLILVAQEPSEDMRIHLAYEALSTHDEEYEELLPSRTSNLQQGYYSRPP